MRKLTLLMLLSFNISAMAVDHYVKGDGTGTFTTIAQVNAHTFVAGDQILFNRGETFIGALVVGQSGSSGSPITYGAYGTGNDPIITGFTSVTAWANLGSNIWESTNAVSSLSDCNMVVINGVNTPMGRTPNTGYYYYQSYTPTSITSNNLTGTPNWTGAELVFNPIDYYNKRYPITSQSGGTLNFATSTTIYRNNQKLIIQNHPSTLDIQNEWYYNPSTKKLRIYSTSQPTDVKVSTVDILINVVGKSYITIDNISVSGSNQTSIYASASPNLTVQNCKITFSGFDAMASDWGGDVYNLKIENCVIDQSNSNAICFPPTYKNAIIRSNTVSNSGMIYGGSRKVKLGDGGLYQGINSEGSGTLIENNTIINSGYLGIRFLGSNSIVQNNFVSGFCILNHDGGGIYTWNGYNTTYTGTKILNNIVIGTGADGISSDSDMDGGIYLDDYSNGIEVSGNTVSGSEFGVYLHEAHDVIVQGNTLFNNDKGIRIYGKSSPFVMTNITNQNNTIVAKYTAQTCMHIDPVELVIQTYSGSSNLYGRPINNGSNIGAYIRTPSFSSWSKTVAQWQTYSSDDSGSYDSPFTVTSPDDLYLAYNATGVTADVPLTASYKELDGTTYTSGSISLPAWGSEVLFYTGQIVGGDTPPIISAFTIPTTSDTLYISGISITASDDVGVTGYALTESSTPPLVGSSVWVSSAPTSYTFSSYGILTLWAWVKDVSGNISSPISRNISIYPQYLIPTKRVFRNLRTGVIYNRNNLRQQY